MKKAFYPYRFAPNELNFRVLNLTVDDVPHNENVAGGDLTISLTDFTEWEHALIDVQAQISSETALELIPEDERLSPPWRVIGTVLCEKSRWRKGFALTSDGANSMIWTGTIPLEHSKIRETVRLHAYLVRAKSRIDSRAGFAESKAARLASSQEWTVRVDQPPILPGGFLKVLWEDFRSSQHPRRAENPTSVYYLDLNDSQPILWLNEAVADLKPVLMSAATTGPKAAVRNALFDSITQAVTISLLMTASLAAPDKDSEPPEEWQRLIVKHFAPLIYRGSTEDEAVTQLIGAAHDRDQLSTLIEAVVLVIQSTTNFTKSTDSILSILEGL